MPGPHRERWLSPASVKFAASGMLYEFLFVVVVVLLLHSCNIWRECAKIAVEMGIIASLLTFVGLCLL